ncbi:MAG: hypothetical protein M3436_04210 [Pseudomonadota bacterium]|nr:hypothetical protein [Pseudomonadota bacterium]
MKANAARGDRQRDKAHGRWLGDFLNQDTPSGLLPAEKRVLDACALGQASSGIMHGEKQEPIEEQIRVLPLLPAARVRAGFLRFLVLGGDESAPVHEAGIELYDAFIDGELDLRGATCIGRLALIRCCVDGKLKIEDATLGILYLEGSRVHGIDGNRARIAGSVFLEKGFVSEGTIKLFGAGIDGSLQCGGAKIGRMKQQDALVCTAARISGNVFLNAGFESVGCVWLNGAEIRGKLDCTKGNFTNPQGNALNFDGAKISSSVFLNDATIDGPVSLVNARVGANVSFTGASITLANGIALDCTSTNIGGSALLNQAFDQDRKPGQPFIAMGGVSNAPNKEHNGAAGYALNLGIANIKYELLFGTLHETDDTPAVIKGSVFLCGAKTRELADRGFVGKAGPASEYFPETVEGLHGESLTCDMVLDGFIYERLNGNSCLTSSAREKWLKRQPKKHLSTDFRHQPFDHLVKVLRTMGRDDEARNIAVLKQRCLTRPTKPASWLWRTLFDLFMSYGHRPARGLIIALIIAATTGWFYDRAAQNGALTTKELGSQFHPYIYSFDVMLPVVKLGEAEAWKPSRNEFSLRLPLGLGEQMVCADCTQYVVWLETVFGWLAGGLLVAVVAGLIKKD